MVTSAFHLTSLSAPRVVYSQASFSASHFVNGASYYHGKEFQDGFLLGFYHLPFQMRAVFSLNVSLVLRACILHHVSSSRKFVSCPENFSYGCGE
jgi:hypothetical protein